MLKMLREHATSWMLRVILILVAVTFISWGGYSLIREKKETYAAKVNGKVIDMREYLDILRNTVDQYRKAFGPSFSEKMIEDLHLREKVLDDLISRVLILEEGERLGLAVSDEELREAIESLPYFQVNGQFDGRTYERFLRLSRMTPDDFERMQRQGLLFSRVVNLVRLNGGKVSEEEILDNYLFENERISLSFIKVAPESLRGQVTANEVETKDYYQKHQEEFRIPTALQIQYLVFRPSDLEGKTQVSPEEIKRFYDTQKDRFKTPKRLKLRDILIKVAAEETPEKAEEMLMHGHKFYEDQLGIEIAAKNYTDLYDEQFDVVINATSAGLSDSTIPLPDTIFAPSALAYDMVYGRETPFMAFAREHGARVADGLGMLVEQAAEAFFIWRGVRPDTHPVLEALRAA